MRFGNGRSRVIGQVVIVGGEAEAGSPVLQWYDFFENWLQIKICKLNCHDS